MGFATPTESRSWRRQRDFGAVTAARPVGRWPVPDRLDEAAELKSAIGTARPGDEGDACSSRRHCRRHTLWLMARSAIRMAVEATDSYTARSSWLKSPTDHFVVVDNGHDIVPAPAMGEPRKFVVEDHRRLLVAEIESCRPAVHDVDGHRREGRRPTCAMSSNANFVTVTGTCSIDQRDRLFQMFIETGA